LAKPCATAAASPYANALAAAYAIVALFPSATALETASERANPDPKQAAADSDKAPAKVVPLPRLLALAYASAREVAIAVHPPTATASEIA